ncbi:MAG: FAD-binding oxidoreductase [Ardenticatenaceae bacterium]|nr:FAD-binding oxidoreductase [Ardenticatenaceae bacterium]
MSKENSFFTTNHLEPVTAWGGASSSTAYVYRPSTIEELRDILTAARQNDRTIAFKGGGNSYGDAFSNREQVVLDLMRMNRILEWDPQSGIIRVEAGVTIDQLWRYVLGDGWWPPIVTGTAKTTVGGCAAMNTHGKNAWKMGTFGDHVLEFDLLRADGEIVTASRETNPELFHAAIGGFGMLGCFTTLTLKLKKIYSGMLHVEGASQPNLAGAMRYIEERLDNSDYLVGWLDATSGGRGLGRAEMHRGIYFQPGEDPFSAQTMQVEHQLISDSIMGILPKSSMWFYMRPFMNQLGLRLVNTAKYFSARMLSGEKGHLYQQSHVAYHFLLDYLPNWKKAYGRNGLIQYQAFVPVENAEQAFTDIFTHCQKRGLPNYLSVMKRHKPDDFLISYGVDGFSMAMDFRITNRNRPKMVALTQELDEIVLRHSGRFYLAKDSTMRPQTVQAYLGQEVIKRFCDLKEQYDPEHLFQSDMWRRLFAVRSEKPVTQSG